MKYKVGDVVKGYVQFSDDQRNEERWLVILDESEAVEIESFYETYNVTSFDSEKDKDRFHTNIPIERDKTNGLTKDSYVKLNRVYEVNDDCIFQKRGELSQEDVTILLRHRKVIQRNNLQERQPLAKNLEATAWFKVYKKEKQALKTLWLDDKLKHSYQIDQVVSRGAFQYAEHKEVTYFDFRYKEREQLKVYYAETLVKDKFFSNDDKRFWSSAQAPSSVKTPEEKFDFHVVELATKGTTSINLEFKNRAGKKSYIETIQKDVSVRDFNEREWSRVLNHAQAAMDSQSIKASEQQQAPSSEKKKQRKREYLRQQRGLER